MRIKVQSDDTNFKLWLPTRVFLNPLSAIICTLVVNNKKYSKFSIKVPYSDMVKLFRAVKKSRHALQGQPLVSVCSSDGSIVEIWI